ncbi:CotH kinase family protein [Alicycliphilus denitrificans]|uniref:CotH kinase family protein n=1 Tax=Alicycliphilus denitrificans TaxID=179636 RepID=UPI000C9F248A|nr:CotH kinase family protein [Alicycliphilus denitrificans]
MHCRPSLRIHPAVLGACLALASCGGGDYESLPEPPPQSQAPFAPGPDDLPRVQGLYPYATPALLTLDLGYQPTPVSGPGWYLAGKDSCQQLASPPPSYPGGMVTLDTVDLDENKADNCEPEIKVLATSGDGQVVNAAAKMRMRGSSTREATLKSYRVKFDKGAAWWGEDTLNLNKHPYDLTRVRNKLAFDLMRTVPYHESLRTQFVGIRYDAADGAGPRPMGLYTHVEKLGGKSYLAFRGWAAGSNVYKVASFNFNADARLQTLAGGKAGPDFEQLLEIESDAGNHQAIVDAVKALDSDETPFQATFARYFDRNNYLAWLATAILLGNWDTANQNFGLYQPLGGEKFYFLPWDYDGALGYAQQPGAAAYPSWNRGLSSWWDSALHRRFLSAPGNLALLQAAVEEIRGKYLTDAAVRQLLDSYRPIVEPILARAPDVDQLDARGQGTPMEQWAAEYQRLQTVIGANHGFFLESLQRPMPYWLAGSDKGGSLELDWSWPAPFHPQGRAIGYRVEVARAEAGQPAFASGTLVQAPASVSGRTTLSVGALPAGQYLVRVTASDPEGHSTTAFDKTTFDGQRIDGAICLQMPGATPCGP